MMAAVEEEEEETYSSNFCWSNSYSTSSSTGILIVGYGTTASAAKLLAPTVVASLFVEKVVVFIAIESITTLVVTINSNEIKS